MVITKVTSILVLGIFIAGCSNVGNAPAGQSADEAKAAFESQSPQDKIKTINASPMQPEEKQRRINEIKSKAGMPLDTPEPSAAPAGAPSTSAAGGPAVGSFPGDPRSGK